ncbi:MAG: hypothetical protein IH842_03690 [Thaumarchaeota archaeon]|nr:hypothetical protein [Nitrososphaerota archaeon]
MGNWLKIGIPVIAVAILSITIISISAEEELIPSWIRNTAGFWVDRQISDQEFINALQYLINQGILLIPEQTDGSEFEESPLDFKVITCESVGADFLKVGVQITNNRDKAISLELVYKGVDVDGNVVSFETGYVLNIRPGQTVFEDRLIDNHPEIDSCKLGLNDAWNP